MWQTGTQITNHESMLDHSVVTISITNSSGEEKKTSVPTTVNIFGYYNIFYAIEGKLSTAFQRSWMQSLI